MAKVIDYRSLTGTERAAIVMLIVGEDNVIKLFGLMEDDEIRDISHAMANLGNVPSETIERLLVDFVESLSTTGNLIGSLDSTEKLLRRAVPADRVGGILEEIRGPAGRTMWDKLANVSEVVLANYLRNEYPQTIAVVLTKIKPDHAGRVLQSMPGYLAEDVLARMLRMENIQREVIEDVERTLRNEFVSNIQRGAAGNSHETIAEILNGMDRPSEARFLNHLDQVDRESAESIRSMMFTFEDLTRLDTVGIQALIRQSDATALATALKGTSEELSELFFGNMSQRAVRVMKEDMDNMGPLRMRVVQDAQGEIVNMAKSLAASGEIFISDSKFDGELVY